MPMFFSAAGRELPGAGGPSQHGLLLWNSSGKHLNIQSHHMTGQIIGPFVSVLCTAFQGLCKICSPSIPATQRPKQYQVLGDLCVDLQAFFKQPVCEVLLAVYNHSGTKLKDFLFLHAELPKFLYKLSNENSKEPV